VHLGIRQIGTLRFGNSLLNMHNRGLAMNGA
jgi:hypothetical protein